MAKKKNHGNYCWACGENRPNERFSGGGHRRHVCKECDKLGPEELAYLQEVRNIDRCLDFAGGIRRKQGKTFERFFNHSNPRVKEYALQVKGELDAERQALRAANIECELLQDEHLFKVLAPEDHL